MRQLYAYGANESTLNTLLYVKIVINVIISFFYKELHIHFNVRIFDDYQILI